MTPALLLLQPGDDAAGLVIQRLPRGIDDQHDRIGVGGAAPGGGDHGAVQAPARRKDARRVDENELRRALGHDAEHAAAGGLHLGADDRDLLADRAVDQVDLPALGAPRMATKPQRLTGGLASDFLGLAPTRSSN